MEQETGVFKYVLRFGLTYMVLSLLVWLLLEVLNAISSLEINIYLTLAVTLGALGGAAMFAVSKFIQDNKRIPASQEKSKLIWFSFLTSWLLQILVFFAAIIFLPEGKKMIEDIRSDGFLFILFLIIFISVFYLGLLSLFYGNSAKKRFEIMQKQGQI